MDVDEAAEQLYALVPAQFTARRTALAAQARSEGARDAAKDIARLQRPSVSAGLINQFVRGAEAGVTEQLLTLGDQLREAQAELDGARMRELTRERHQLVATLVRQVSELAAESDQKVSGAVQRELEETFGAALADEQAAQAVISGRLTRALVYAGLGEVDVTAATATPLRRAPTPKPASTPPERRQHTAETPLDLGERRRAAEQAKREAADEALESARANLSEAEEELSTADTARQSAQAHEAELGDRLDELQRQILQTRHDLDAAGRGTANAERDHRRQERQVQEAQKALRQAEQARARLEPDT